MVAGTMMTACQEDRTILPDLGMVAVNDLNVAGGGVFDYADYAPLANRPLKVWYFTPHDNPKDAPILFVMHGVDRNGQTYRNNWVNLARQHNVLLIVPEFSTAHYPGSRMYNQGNMFTSGGTPIPEEEWSFSVIEPLFDHVVSEIGGNQTQYHIFGHSAGSQFVSRFLTFKSDLRVNRAICANAGTYTLLDREIGFPYGLSNTGLTDEQIDRVLSRDVVILLGEADTVVDSNLDTSPQANAQGPHRFARGQFFYNHLQEVAAGRNLPLAWQLATVPGVGHSNRLIAPAAMALLTP